MSTSTQLRIAVIGVGRMGQHHARIYSQLAVAEGTANSPLPPSRLAAVCDQNREQAEKIAAQYGCSAFTDVREMLAATAANPISAATIAVPTIYHRAVAEQLLAQGVDCLIEKPLAACTADAAAIVQLANQKKRILQVGHTERFNPVVRALREYKLQPKFLEIDRISPMTFRSIDVSVVLDMMIHDLDLVNYFVGSSVVEVAAVGVAVISAHADIANARLRFANNAVANITASRLAMKTERKMRLFMPDAFISVDYQKKTGVIIRKGAHAAQLAEIQRKIAAGNSAELAATNYLDLINAEPIVITDQEPLRAELESFLLAVAQRTRPEVSGEDGLAAVDLAQRVEASIAGHKWN